MSVSVWIICIDGKSRYLYIVIGNPVAHDRYRFPTVYFFMTDIENPDLFVCCCWTWIGLDITRFYEEHRHPSSGSA